MKVEVSICSENVFAFETSFFFRGNIHNFSPAAMADCRIVIVMTMIGCVNNYKCCDYNDGIIGEEGIGLLSDA